jgi:hypothetical protein
LEQHLDEIERIEDAWRAPRLLRMLCVLAAIFAPAVLPQAARAAPQQGGIPYHSSSSCWGGATLVEEEIILPRSRVRESS